MNSAWISNYRSLIARALITCTAILSNSAEAEAPVKDLAEEQIPKKFAKYSVSCGDRKLLEVVNDYLADRIHQPFTKTEFERAVSVLSKIDGIQKIDLLVQNQELIARITPLERLRSVRVSGNNHFSASTILSAIDLPAEKTQYLGDLDSYRQAIQKLYLESGFPNVEVTFELTRSSLFPTPELAIDIQENEPLVFSDLLVRGEYAPLSTEDILGLLDLRRGEHFDPTKVDARIERLQQKYSKLGFRSCQISKPEIIKDADTKKITIVLEVKRGPYVTVSFHGEKYFFQDRDAILREVIGLENESRFSRGYLEEAIEKLRDFYSELGYLFAEIRYEVQPESAQKNLNIVFFIEKRKRVRIRSIKIDAPASLKSDRVRSLLTGIDIGGPYYRAGFRRSVRNLRGDLQELGFHDAKEAEFKEELSNNRQFVDLIVIVEPGQLYRFGSTEIRVKGALSPEELQTKLNYKTGKPFELSKYETSIRDLQNYCVNVGYKFCRVEAIAKQDAQEERKNVQIDVDTGEKVFFGSFFVEGNRLTDRQVILRELRLNKGDSYSLEKLAKSRRAIQRLGFFSSVQIEELDYHQPNQTIVYLIRVREKKQRNIRFRVGFGSDEGARARTDFSYLNLGGHGRNVYLSTGLSREVSGNIFEWRVIANYIEPYLLELPVNGRAQFSFQRDEEEFGNIDRTGFFLGVEYVRLDWLQTLAKWEIESRKPFDLKIPDEDLSDFDESRRRFGSLGTVFTLDFRDDPFNPRFGYLGQITTDFFLEAVLSEEEFYQVFSRNSFYLPIYQEIGFVLSLRFGFSATFGSTAAAGSTAIPVEKRFRLGGSQSLRGFSLDSVGGQGPNEPALSGDQPAPGGNSVFNYLAEITVPLALGFRLVGFTDGGNAFVSNGDFDPTDLRHSAGAGLRYITPIGPLRLDFGFKLDRRTGESLGEVHFAVGLF